MTYNFTPPPPPFVTNFQSINWEEEDDELFEFDFEVEGEEESPITERSVATHPLAKKIDMPDGSEAMRCVDCLNDFIGAKGNQQDGSFLCRGCLYWHGN